MKRESMLPFLALLIITVASIGIGAISFAEKEKNRTTIVDTTGEEWDVIHQISCFVSLVNNHHR
jgi:hypothetical protein